MSPSWKAEENVKHDGKQIMIKVSSSTEQLVLPG